MSLKFFLRLIILVILFVVVVVLISLVNRDDSGVEISPKNANNVSGPIVIKYLDLVNERSGDFDIEPNVEGSVMVVDNYVIFWPKYDTGFPENISYTFSASNYTSTEGNKLEDVKHTFSIKRNKDYEPLQLEVLGKYGSYEEPTDPFLSLLPYKKDYSYQILYETPLESGEGDKFSSDQVYIIVETLLGQGRNDSIEEYLGFVKEARNDALGWIKSQGVDTKTLNIEYRPTDEEILTPGFEDAGEILID